MKALKCLGNLEKTVQELIDSNESLRHQLEQFDFPHFEDTSIRLFDDGESISDFDNILRKTRVYGRVQSNDCGISFQSSATRTTSQV